MNKKKDSEFFTIAAHVSGQAMLLRIGLIQSWLQVTVLL